MKKQTLRLITIIDNADLLLSFEMNGFEQERYILEHHTTRRLIAKALQIRSSENL